MSQHPELKSPPPFRAVPVLEAVEPAPRAALQAEAPDAELVPESILQALPAPQNQDGIQRLFWFLVGIPEWLFGVAVLCVTLAALAPIPGVQFLSLGYLLESAGRVARSGRFRDAFIGVRKAARIGGVIVATWLLLLPLRLLADMAHSAEVIAPGGRSAVGLRVALYISMVFVFVHVLTACALGGRLRYFAFPFSIFILVMRIARGGYYVQARDAVWDTVMAMRLPYFFWMGLRGTLIAFAWIALPATLMATAQLNYPITNLTAFIGGLMMIVVLIYLPFLQTRMAQQDRLSAGFEWLSVRRDFRKAPWAFAFAFFITLAFALPLYLLKIEFVPREVAWLPGLFFLAFIFPARLLTGWALGRAARREKPRHWFFRWTGRLPFLPAAVVYVFIVFVIHPALWNGVWELYQQHAFLFPVPFVSM